MWGKIIGPKDSEVVRMRGKGRWEEAINDTDGTLNPLYDIRRLNPIIAKLPCGSEILQQSQTNDLTNSMLGFK